jgi:hypothetical protein
LSLVFLVALAGGAACNSRPAAPPAGRAPAVQRPEASPKVGDDTDFFGTITSIDIGNVRHPFLRWNVTVKIDEILSGHRPGDSFWFAIHSPSQEGFKVGQRVRIRATKTADGYSVRSYRRLGS